MTNIVSTFYEIKQTIEKEFGAISNFNIQITADTPASNLSIDVHLGGVVYPFFVDDTDFEDVPLLIGFMKQHIEREKKILDSNHPSETAN